MAENLIYDQMKSNSIALDTISEGHIKNVAFISLRISLMSFFRTAKALNRYMNDTSVRNDMSQHEKDTALGIVYAHEAYNAVFHFQNFLELAIKDIRYSITRDENLYEDTFYNNLQALVASIDNNTIPSDYYFIKNYYWGIRTINKLRNDAVHSGVFILRSEALNELFGKYAFPLMIEISKLQLFAGNRYWRYNLDNDDIHPIENIIEEYKHETVNQYKIQLLKLIATAAFDNEIFISKKDLNNTQPDIFNNSIAALYEMIYAKRVKKAEKEAEDLSLMNQMDARVCPVCQNKTLVLEQDTYDDGEDNYCNYTYEVHCTQCGFKLDHYLINRIKDTGVTIENYEEFHS